MLLRGLWKANKGREQSGSKQDTGTGLAQADPRTVSPVCLASLPCSPTVPFHLPCQCKPGLWWRQTNDLEVRVFLKALKTWRSFHILKSVHGSLLPPYINCGRVVKRWVLKYGWKNQTKQMSDVGSQHSFSLNCTWFTWGFCQNADSDSGMGLRFRISRFPGGAQGQPFEMCWSRSTLCSQILEQGHYSWDPRDSWEATVWWGDLCWGLNPNPTFNRTSPMPSWVLSSLSRH